MPSSNDSPLEYSDSSTFPKLVDDLRRSFRDHKMLFADLREQQLKQLYRLFKDNKDILVQSVVKDLKCTGDATLEYKYILSEICYTLNNFRSWMKPNYVSKPLMNKIDDCYVKHDALGVVLIIGAWNFPLTVAIEPLLGALAAGNCVVLKPSEISSNTARTLKQLFEKYMDPLVIRVVNCGPKETSELIKLKWDHIFYTGSATIGKIVYEEAAKNLTPVTLELGGKSPLIVADDANIATAANRIVWGKFTNAGQTCIAPDYVLCSKSTASKLINAVKTCIKTFYGEDISKSSDYGRIINEHHVHRLIKLVEENKKFKLDLSQTEVNISDRFIPPMIFEIGDTQSCSASSLMSEEIFGPLLPIVYCDSVNKAIDFVNSREKPLALYVFSSSKETVRQVLDNTTSGGVCVNDIMMHVLLNSLPFGGVGSSGFGNYHGRFSFETFSHKKAVMWRSEGMEWINTMARYPPQNSSKASILDAVMFNS